MATHSIGVTARDYATITLWAAACPANITAGGTNEIWKGECYNDATFTESVTISGITTDSTHYVWLTAAAGQSHVDQGSSTALVYGMTGVTVTSNTAFFTTLANTTDYFLLERLQISGGGGYSACFSSNVFTQTTNQCILHNKGAFNCTFNNCLFQNDASGEAFSSSSSFLALNYCTLVHTNSGGALYTFASYQQGTVNNCACFGWSSWFNKSGSGTLSGDYNCTDNASFNGTGETHSLASKTFANQFNSTTNDFRVKSSGSDLAGNANPTSNTIDIVGTTRSVSTPTIGAWELVTSGGSSPTYPQLERLTQGLGRGLIPGVIH